MKYRFILLFCLSFIIVSCSENNNEPKSNEDLLIGYWAITHIKTIVHKGEIHSTFDNDIPPHGVDCAATIEAANTRYDVLIFDENMVTIRGDLPNRPNRRNYAYTLDGECEYAEDLSNWMDGVAECFDQFECPVGSYYIQKNNLIIGSLNVGQLNFVSDDEFILEYKQNLNNSGDYIHSTYTYTRIYSLYFR